MATCFRVIWKAATARYRADGAALCVAALVVANISGCASNLGFGWVNDPDRYWDKSGFSVQAPSGPNWRITKPNDDYPNAVSFSKVEVTPIRNNPYHPEFTVTSAVAFGVSTGYKVAGKSDHEKVLREYLKQYQKKSELSVESSVYETSLGAECIDYRGKPVVTDLQTDYGVVRIDSVRGRLCLHPEYDDFVVLLESRNGASVEIRPANRDQQVEHFFKSIRFIPRIIPSTPAGTPSRDEDKRRAG